MAPARGKFQALPGFRRPFDTRKNLSKLKNVDGFKPCRASAALSTRLPGTWHRVVLLFQALPGFRRPFDVGIFLFGLATETVSSPAGLPPPFRREELARLDIDRKMFQALPGFRRPFDRKDKRRHGTHL